MNNTKGGLSYFKDGGESDDSSTADTTTTAQAQAKTGPAVISSGKAKYVLPQYTGTSAVGESTLANMQRLLEEKQAQQQSFQERLRDAKAWFTGMGGTQAQALQGRTQEREQQAADIFNMQNAIAQAKAQQQKAQDFQKRVAPSFGVGTQPQAGGANLTGVPAQGGMVMPPPSDPMYNALQTAYQSGDEATFNKLYGEWAKKQSEIKTSYDYNVGLDAIAKFPVNGQLVDMTLRQAKKLAENDPNLKAYIDKITGVPPATSNVVTPAAPSVINKPAATTTTAPAATTITAPAATSTTAPAATTSGINVAGGRPSTGLPSSADIQQRQEIEKAEILARTKGREKEFEKLGEKAGVLADAIETSHRDYTNNKVSYEKIGKLTESNPFAFGVLQRPDLLSGALNAIKQGATVGNYNVNFPGVENLVRQTGGTDADVTAANLAIREFAKLQLNASRLIQGQGSVSDAERVLLAQVAGSASDDPRTIKELVKWGKARAEFDKELGDAWKDYKVKTRGAGSFRDFYISPEYDRIMANWDKKNQAMLDSFSSGAPVSGARAEMERRRKLKQQGQ